MEYSPRTVRLPEHPGDHRVVVLGASPKPARYSNQAVRLLKAADYRVIPVHPKIGIIEELRVVPHLGAIRETVHTLTLYVGPERSHKLGDAIVGLNPWRVIFNPGTESPSLKSRLQSTGVECIHGCTLVMLRTGQF
jgi:predicted CoA-binding protein